MNIQATASQQASIRNALQASFDFRPASIERGDTSLHESEAVIRHPSFQVAPWAGTRETKLDLGTLAQTESSLRRRTAMLACVATWMKASLRV
jgi:hypothetical protein